MRVYKQLSHFLQLTMYNVDEYVDELVCPVLFLHAMLAGGSYHGRSPSPSIVHVVWRCSSSYYKFFPYLQFKTYNCSVEVCPFSSYSSCQVSLLIIIIFLFTQFFYRLAFLAMFIIVGRIMQSSSCSPCYVALVVIMFVSSLMYTKSSSYTQAVYGVAFLLYS